ncbi:MAG: translocation/assembly module TamB domain-containing protein [Algoriphagus sp.]|uniref:translocation/assembly module TamB domain-containing protein n=1 Tax=Algoriphagus sp. TaxID=1872435 RepID=UPI00329899ED
MILFIRSPWGQGILVDKATSYVANKIGTEVAIERLFITFSGNIYLEGLYLEDTQGDTLIYSKNLEAGVAIAPLISTGNINVTKLNWEGVVARVSRSAETEKFNFDFILEAFASQPADSTQITPTDTTASNPLKIKLSPISLRDFDVSYLDEVMGITAAINLGQMDVSIPGLDLETYEFDVEEIALQNTQINYQQTKPFPPTEETETESLLPNLTLERLSLTNVSADYSSVPDKQKAQVQLAQLLVELPKADLQSQTVKLSTLALENSSILFHDFSIPTSPDSTSEDSSTPFEWPAWTVEADEIRIDSTNIEYKTADVPFQKGFFNPEAISISDLTFAATNIFLEDKKAGASLQEFHFQEASGFELKEFQFGLEAGNSTTTIDNLILATNRSSINAEISLDYPSIQELIENPTIIDFDFLVNNSTLDVRDSYFFAPELAQDTLIQELEAAPFELQLQAKGDLASLEVSEADLAWGQTTFDASGSVQNALDVNQLAFDFPKLHLRTNRTTLLKFINEEDYGIQLPEEISMQASTSGTLEDLLADLSLETDFGTVLLDGAYQNNGQLAFDADLRVNQLQLGNLLQQPELDTLTVGIKINGSGSSLQDLNAELTSTFERLKLYGSDYSGLKLEGKIVNGAGDIEAGLDSEFLVFDLLTEVDLDSTNAKVDLQLDLQGADFFELGLTEKSTRAQLKLLADFEGNLEEFDLHAELQDATLIYDGRTYPVGELLLNGSVREDSTSVDIASSLLNGFVRTNTNPTELATALGEHFRQYLDRDDSLRRAADRDIVMNVDLKISDDPLLSEVLLQGIEQFDSARIHMDYFQDLDSLTANIDFPYVNYGGTEVDSLGVRVRSDRDSLSVYFGFQNLTSGPLDIGKTYFTGQLSDARLYFDFNSYEEEERTYHVASDIGINSDTISLHISPKELLLKGEEWQVPEGNLVEYSSQKLEFKEFHFTKANQEISFVNNVDGFTEENIAMVFEEFRLSTITSLLNPEEIIAGGKMDGRLVVENPFAALALMGHLTIDSLKVVNVPLGNLNLLATAKSLGNYVLELGLKDGGFDLDLKGDYVASEAGGEFDLQLDLNRIEMEKIAALSQDQILNASGYLTGTITANGTTSDPRYEGEIQFNKTSFVPAQLSTTYMLADEKIRVDNEGVYFDKFTFEDTDKNTFEVDGMVGTESFLNPTFDLELTADNFMAVNSTDSENELVYGKATLSADISINGDLILPVVRARLTIKDNTDLTIIIPESELDLVERQGVVVFVNKQNPDNILTRQLEENTSAFSGYDIQAILNIDPIALFTIIIDPSTGDNLQIGGEADLQMDINPNGRITLSGNFEISTGHYEMSLYNLVSRKFEINPGSRISWNGDPMDADLDIQAIYRVETAAADLMSAQLTGSNKETQAQYKQQIPFLVYLNVNGELLQPEISFLLDMPEDQRGAFGGNVYSRVLQINEQEDELNKQVFSLLVLNRFFPSSGSDGSGGGAEAIARNSVSQVLSDQMNALSNKLFGDSGFQVGFDVDSYQDYQSGSATNRTDLNINAQQTLFDDRLIVQVGSQVDLEGSSQGTDQANSILANVSFEYLLTEDGRWRIRAFRKNQFESIIDGQLVVTGGGLIFNREFNEFSELFKSPISAEDQPKTNPTDELENTDKKKNKEENEN